MPTYPTANIYPIFPRSPVIGRARLSAAVTASNGSGSLTTLLTAGASGSRVDYITFTNSQLAMAASSAMVGKVFLSNTAAADPYIIAEVAIATVTRSATAVGATQTITFAGGLVIPSGSVISVAQSVYAGAQDQFDVIARGGHY